MAALKLWEHYTAKLLGYKWYHHVQKDDVRWTTKQSHISVISKHGVYPCSATMWEFQTKADAKKILGLENWRRPPGRPRTTWMKTIQQDLKCNNLSLNEAVDLAQNRPLWRLILCMALLVVHERNEWINECQINQAFPLNIFDSYEIFAIHSSHISGKKSQILRLSWRKLYLFLSDWGIIQFHDLLILSNFRSKYLKQ